MTKRKKFKLLNPLLHSQLRLSIMSYLISNGTSDFNEIKQITEATSGNISVQIKKLTEADYIRVEKGFLNNYQHTKLVITEVGIKAFEDYVKDLKEYIQ